MVLYLKATHSGHKGKFCQKIESMAIVNNNPIVMAVMPAGSNTRLMDMRCTIANETTCVARRIAISERKMTPAMVRRYSARRERFSRRARDPNFESNIVRRATVAESLVEPSAVRELDAY